MGGQYILNTGTHFYHILGDCHYQNRPDQRNKVFCRENDLKAYDPRARLCTMCQRKRERRDVSSNMKYNSGGS